MDEMSKSEKAVELFQAGLNCSQAVLSVFAEDCDLDPDSALKVACGFGGGMGRTGGTCGAVTGAIMVLGIAQSGPDPGSMAAKVRVYGLVQYFLDEFTERQGSTACRDLLGCDIGTPEGYQQAAGDGLFQSRCPRFVADAVAILDDMV